MGMLSGSGSGEHNDMDRFYDSCDDGRTDKQLMWEDGVYKEGSLRKKWADCFGKNDITKLGRKAEMIVLAMAGWVVLDMLLGGGAAKMLFQCLCVGLAALAEMYIYKGSKMSRPHVIYAAVLCILPAVLYKPFSYVFGNWGYSVFEAAYAITNVVIPTSKYVIYGLIFVAGAVSIFKNKPENICDTAVYALFVITAALCITAVFSAAYKPLSCAAAVCAAAAVILYIKSKNKFMLNLTLLTAFFALSQAVGINFVE